MIETGNGALRLIWDNQYSDTQAWKSGIVQIYYGGSWGNICNNFYFAFAEADGDVISLVTLVLLVLVQQVQSLSKLISLL